MALVIKNLTQYQSVLTNILVTVFHGICRCECYCDLNIGLHIPFYNEIFEPTYIKKYSAMNNDIVESQMSVSLLKQDNTRELLLVTFYLYPSLASDSYPGCVLTYTCVVTIILLLSTICRRNSNTFSR